VIPFNRPYLTGNEFTHIQEALAAGQLSGNGRFTKQCQGWLERLIGAPRVLLTQSCTAALEMAALLTDLEPGDEVIMPSFTFVSTANAFVLRGARPVFVDIRPDTLNLDERALEAAITPRTRAILVVHYAGVACDMDAIVAIAGARGIPIVEDNAHGLFGHYHGRPLGSFGALATLSFHETKNVTCGEGGALLINDPRFVERAEILREKGTNRTRFFRGQIDRYTWVDVGSSYLPSELLAAYLQVQLEARDRIQARRQAIWRRYEAALGATGLPMPTVPAGCDQPAHLFYLLMPSLAARTRLIDCMRARQILLVFHYQPLHLSEMGLRLGGQPGQCPVTEDVADRLVRLPLYFQLQDDEQSRVIDGLEAFVSGAR